MFENAVWGNSLLKPINVSCLIFQYELSTKDDGEPQIRGRITLSSTNLVEFDGPVGIKPGDVPGVDGRIVPAEGGCVAKT